MTRNVTNVLLTTACALLVANLVVAFASTSHAQTQPLNPPATPGLSGAANNTARTVEALMEVNLRLARIEARMDKGFSVKVTEMPPVTISNSDKANAEPNKP